VARTFIGVPTRTYPRPVPFGWLIVPCDECGNYCIVHADKTEADSSICAACLIAVTAELKQAVMHFADHPMPGSEDVAFAIMATVGRQADGRTH